MLIGSYIESEEGYYIGNLNNYRIIVAPKFLEKSLKWNDAIDYCNEISWRLPSKDVLNFLYKNTANMPSEESFIGHYWSSTETSSTDAWYQSFLSGNQDATNKTYSRYIRPYRRVKIDT